MSDYFVHIPFHVKCNVLSWTRIRSDEKLDRRSQLGTLNCTLSEDLVLGEWIPDRNKCFQIHIGPLSLEEYLSFLPPGEWRRELSRLVHVYVPPQFAFGAVLHIRGEEIPPLILGNDSDTRLGWVTWLVSLPHEDDAVVFPNEEIAASLPGQTAARGS